MVATQPAPPGAMPPPPARGPLPAGANPRWNDVFPITVPGHDRDPQPPGSASAIPAPPSGSSSRWPRATPRTARIA